MMTKEQVTRHGTDVLQSTTPQAKLDSLTYAVMLDDQVATLNALSREFPI
jgi:hypothetical protein